jgi:predicted deacylase
MSPAVNVTRIPRPPAGTKQRSWCEPVPGVRLPVLTARGRQVGKTLVVTAGIHGDEFEGVRAVLEVFASLDPARMAGDWIAVPVANPPALWSGTRTAPDDGVDLARIFPGREGGGLSQSIAHFLASEIIANADFYLDLHSGGVRYRMPSMVGFDAADERSAAAARSFGAPVLWGHSDVPSGRTISFARDRGIPWLYTEARGAGRIEPSDLAMIKSGIRNLMQHLGMLAGAPAPTPGALVLQGSGDIDRAITANRAGFLIPEVAVLDPVEKGAPLGRLLDLLGGTLEEYHAPTAGVVALVREFPVVQPGDRLFLLAERVSR